jgi:hypothetical protein
VTTPSFLKTEGSLARVASVVSGRGCSSTLHRPPKARRGEAREDAQAQALAKRAEGTLPPDGDRAFAGLHLDRGHLAVENPSLLGLEPVLTAPTLCQGKLRGTAGR